MIISALCNYYDLLQNDKDTEISPYGCQEVNVSYCALLSKEGDLKGLISLKELNDGKPRFMSMQSSMKKSSISASPVCDNFEYVFGIEGDKGNKNISEKKFNTAKDLHLRLFEEGISIQAKAIVNFFEKWDIDKAWTNKILMMHYSPSGKAFSGNIVFKLQNESMFFHETQEIIKIWENENLRIKANEDNYVAQCSVTGENQVIARLHNQLRGIRGANATGASLICFNKECDESYNLINSYNSAISNIAMFKYTTALQYLLKNENQRILIGTDTAVFWAESAEKKYVNAFNVLLMNPEEDEKSSIDREALGIVRAVLKDGKKGIWNNKVVVPNTKFYILGISPNAGRISVRFFLDNTFDYFCEKIKSHYDDINIYGGEKDKRVISINRLVYATINSNSKDKKANPLLTGALMRSVLMGSFYPVILFNKVIERIKAERNISHARAAVIKGFINRKDRLQNNKEEILMYLNEESNDTAYVLGRTFAILEKIQKNALGNINSTIKDKYFSRACSNPATVFPNLLKLTQHHLAKIEARIFWDKMLGECLCKIEDMKFPKTMNIDKQGRFILGYYQQVQKLYEKKNDVKEEK